MRQVRTWPPMRRAGHAVEVRLAVDRHRVRATDVRRARGPVRLGRRRLWRHAHVRELPSWLAVRSDGQALAVRLAGRWMRAARGLPRGCVRSDRRRMWWRARVRRLHLARGVRGRRRSERLRRGQSVHADDAGRCLLWPQLRVRGRRLWRRLHMWCRLGGVPRRRDLRLRLSERVRHARRVLLLERRGVLGELRLLLRKLRERRMRQHGVRD